MGEASENCLVSLLIYFQAEYTAFVAFQTSIDTTRVYKDF